MKSFMKTKTSIRLLLAGLCSLPLLAAGAPLVTPDFSGNTQYEGWEELTAANNPGFPGFFNLTDPWPDPIAPNITGSAGFAGFDKVSGGGYPASAAIYNFTVPGTFVVGTSTPLSNLQTVAFQLDLGIGNTFFLSTPVLNYNGGSQQLAPTFAEQGSGPTAFTNPQTGDPDSTTLFGYQWDLSSIGSISEFEILWTTDAHATTYNIRLDSSDTFTGNAISAVPEPALFAWLLGLGALGLAFWRRRKSS